MVYISNYRAKVFLMPGFFSRRTVRQLAYWQFIGHSGNFGRPKLGSG